jgi:hypothetical protein
MIGVSRRSRATSNALHVDVSRLRKRLVPLGLVIRRVRNRGYVLETVHQPLGTREEASGRLRVDP